MRFATYTQDGGPARAGMVGDSGIHPLPGDVTVLGLSVRACPRRWRLASARSASRPCRWMSGRDQRRDDGSRRGVAQHQSGGERPLGRAPRNAQNNACRPLARTRELANPDAFPHLETHLASLKALPYTGPVGDMSDTGFRSGAVGPGRRVTDGS
jgi:hypothetical protein